MSTAAIKEAQRMARFMPHLEKYMPMYGINTPLRMRHFLAQVGHESGGFRYMKEIWGPTEAQKGYEGRKDLGNTQKGDGKKFMGRGPIQITGRTNYRKVSRAIFGDDRLLDYPELLEEPEYAVMSACWWWNDRGLNQIADRGEDVSVVRSITKRVNGGFNGLDDRIARFNKQIMV